MANKQNVTLKKAMLSALEKSLGVVTTAANNVGITRKTHYEWLQKDKEYAEQVKALEDMVLDFAESQLHKQVNEGNTTATIFLLKTKGKKRGYVERQEIMHEGGVTSTLVEWKPADQNEK